MAVFRMPGRLAFLSNSCVSVVYFQLATCCILFALLILQSAGQEFPDKDTVISWGINLENRLRANMTNVTGHHVLKQHYNRYNPQATHVNPLDPKKVVKEISEKLTALFEESMEALKLSVDAAEVAAYRYQWDPKLKISNVTYYDATSLSDDDLVLEYKPRFQQPVNLSASSVHIPVEIYKGDMDILNGLQWSAKLDAVFAANYKSNDNLLWQYFGSQSGFMRTYPASRWRKHGSVDLFDVRRRPWYTQGASSPKDMMIIIDTSGSVHGQALQLIKVAVKSLLDTLGENDFVNIAHFSKEAQFVSCFNDTFVQANYRNKKILTKAVENLTAQDMANFKVGFEFAFLQFEKFRNMSKQNGVGAQCNEVIMLLTDGGTDNAKEVFEKYNWSKNKTVRVFTYAVGPTANPTSAIRWMACGNRGYFSQIPAMGAIRSKVQHYIGVLARPLALNHSEYIKWAGVYQDSHGLGMMTTVTLPVYNRTAGANNQTILGVMGVDITTDDMLKKIQRHQLGPTGYAFAINRNGYVVFHPNLKIPKDWNKDPPNVDFLEVEVENEDKELLRRRMIDGETSTVRIRTFVVSPEGNHVWIENRTYSFTPINETSFSLCVTVPTDLKSYMQPLGITEIEGKSLLRSNLSAMLVAPWDYYNGYTQEINITMTTDDLINVLDNSDYKFDTHLMQLLYWDANITKKMELYWNDVDKINSFNFREDVIATFVGTNGGLTMVYPASEKDRYLKWRDVWKADYYQRALRVDDFVYIAPYRKGSLENSTAPPITVVKSIKIKDKTKTAVIGVTMNHSRIMEEMLAATDSGNVHCRESENLVCFLLDDGAFVISTNQDDKLGGVGQFLGNVDRGLMFGLLNNSVYMKHEISDYQAICQREAKKSTGGLRNIRVPSVNLIYDILSLKWWVNKVAWSYFSFNIYNWLFAKPTDFASAEEEEGEIENCIMNKTQYYWPRSFNFVQGNVPCENCTREFLVVRLIYSNLILVVAEPECTVCSYPKIIQEPVEVEPNFCNAQPRYRKSPGECYKYDSREDGRKCSSTSHLPSYIVLLGSHLLLALCILHLTHS